jgi:hypothetical protein
MTLPHTTLGAAHFEALYASDPDPLEARYQPLRSRQIRRHPGHAAARATPAPWRSAAPSGSLTRMLAPRCDRLLAVDGSARAIASAGRGCGGLPGLSLE